MQSYTVPCAISHAPCTILQDTLTTSACFPRSPKSGLIFSGSCVLLVWYHVTHVCRETHTRVHYCFHPLPRLPYLACPILSARPYQAVVDARDPKSVPHFHALSPSPLGSDDARGIEDATLPLDLTPTREPDWVHRIHGLSPSGIARQPVPQYVPQPASSVVARHVPPSHPTCLIASSVLRSAFARSIRNPFSRLVPGALLDMQQKSVEPSRPTLLHILAHMPRQKPAGTGRGRTRGSFQPSCPRRRILMSLCSARSLDCTVFPASSSTAVARTAWTVTAGHGSRRLIVSITPGATSESFSTSCHRSALTNPRLTGLPVVSTGHSVPLSMG